MRAAFRTDKLHEFAFVIGHYGNHEMVADVGPMEHTWGEIAELCPTRLGAVSWCDLMVKSTSVGPLVLVMEHRLCVGVTRRQS